MKKIFLLLIICLPLAGFGQTTKKLIVDTIKARVDSVYLKSPIAIKQPVVSTQIINAPLFKIGQDTAGTKKALRDSIYALHVRTALPQNIKASDTTRWANNGDVYTASNGNTMVGKDIQFGGTITDDITVDGTHQVVFGSVTSLTGFAVNVSGDPGIDLSTDSVSLALNQSYFGFKNVFSDNRKYPSGIEYAANYHSRFEPYSHVDKSYTDSAIEANASITPTDDILNWSTNKYTYYADSTGTGVLGGWYLGNQNPAGTIRSNINGHLGINKLYCSDVLGTAASTTLRLGIGSSYYWYATTTYFGGSSSNSSALSRNSPSNTTPSIYTNNSNPTTGIGGVGTNISIIKEGVEKMRVNDSIHFYTTLIINNDSVPARKPMATDTTGLVGKIGETFIDSSGNWWIKTSYNGASKGWKRVQLLYIIPFAFLIRRRKYLKL